MLRRPATSSRPSALEFSTSLLLRANNPSTQFDFSLFSFFFFFLAWDGVHIEQRSQYRLFAFPAFLIPLNLVCLSFISTFYGESVDSGESLGEDIVLGMTISFYEFPWCFLHSGMFNLGYG